jgi:putative peptidoglycan lipid II flippase
MLQAPVADLLALAGSTHGAKEITLLLVVASGGLAYVVLAFLTRAVTVAEVKGLVRRAR